MKQYLERGPLLSEAERFLEMKARVDERLEEKRKGFEAEFNSEAWTDTMMDGKSKEEIVQHQLDLELEDICEEVVRPYMPAGRKGLPEIYYLDLKRQFERDDA